MSVCFVLHGFNAVHLLNFVFLIRTGRRSEVDLRRQNHGRQRSDLHVQHRREEVRRCHGKKILSVSSNEDSQLFLNFVTNICLMDVTL